MRSHLQRHIADLIRQQRFRIEGMRSGLDDGRGELLDIVMLRMFDAEHALEKDLRDRRALRRVRDRVAELFAPRLGILRHNAPHPLKLPAAYWRERPPEPAPTISIVTPSYNQGRFIERTIESVVGQGYPQLEYYVQDGGSSDTTVDILRHHETQLSGWTSEPDDGFGDALNRGFEQTTGEIMAYLNSDDLLLPGTLAFVARYFDDHPDVDVLYGNRVIIDDGDRQIGLWVLPGHDDEILSLIDFVPQETLFWRRRIWDAAGGRFDPTIRFAIDWDLLLRLRDADARFAHVPRFLGAFRVHAAQKTQSQQQLGDDDCDRLRLRTHGREIGLEEAVDRAKPYYRRHVRAHVRERVKARLTLRARALETVPENAWGYTHDAELRSVEPTPDRSSG